MKRREAYIIGFFIFLGILLRLSYPMDMEFKLDESYLFQRVLRELWGSFGDQSSVGINNPPFSVWVFIVVGKIFGQENPMQVCMGVRVLNALGLIALYAYGLFKAKTSPRFAKALLWATAFSAVAPSAILFQKKIWAQSILPFFMAPLWISFFERNRKWAAYLFGILCALVPQIHLSGIFFVSLLILANIFLSDQKPKVPSKPFWIGLSIGLLPLIPWLITNPLSNLKSAGFLPFNEGLGAWKILFSEWLANGFEFNFGEAAIQKMSTALTFQVANAMLGISLGGIAIIRIISHWSILASKPGKRTHEDQSKADPEFRSLLNVSLITNVGYPLLLSLAGFPIFRHYFIVMSPFTYLLPSLLLLFSPTFKTDYSNFSAIQYDKLRTWLSALYAIALLIISIQIISMIHTTKDFTGFDYGKTFESQLRDP